MPSPRQPDAIHLKVANLVVSDIVVLPIDANRSTAGVVEKLHDVNRQQRQVWFVGDTQSPHFWAQAKLVLVRINP